MSGCFDTNKTKWQLEIEKQCCQNDGYSIALESRIEKLEEKISEKYAHPDVIGRIEKLEKFDQYNTEIISNIKKQINDWEEGFYFLKDKLRQYDRKPHRCPICNGNRNIYSVYNHQNMSTIFLTLDCLGRCVELCHPCEGKGIIWG